MVWVSCCCIPQTTVPGVSNAAGFSLDLQQTPRKKLIGRGREPAGTDYWPLATIDAVDHLKSYGGCQQKGLRNQKYFHVKLSKDENCPRGISCSRCGNCVKPVTESLDEVTIV